jgi:hypothetical protein
MRKAKWDPPLFILSYPECTGNALRGLAALGVDTEIAASEYTINLFVLSRSIFPVHPDKYQTGFTRDVNIYFASPTGCEDNPISLTMDESIDYRGFLHLIHIVCSFRVKDPFWQS